MEQISYPELLRFVRHINLQKLVPMLLFGSRVRKPRLIKQLSRYWDPRYFPTHIVMIPRVVVPRFHFDLTTRRWSFEQFHSPPVAYSPDQKHSHLHVLDM